MLSASSSAGLSPRVRGSRHHVAALLRAKGSIPACAGKPTQRVPRSDGTGVYPRVCGEAPCDGLLIGRLIGLSPRVRGSQMRALAERLKEGSIPACAGKPDAGARGAPQGRVYPRVCGEALMIRHRAVDIEGLSPRVRGSRQPMCRAPYPSRSIPACAGKPTQTCRARSVLRVYPRVCGEAFVADDGSEYGSGLSPRVRGSLYGL